MWNTLHRRGWETRRHSQTSGKAANRWRNAYSREPIVGSGNSKAARVVSYSAGNTRRRATDRLRNRRGTREGSAKAELYRAQDTRDAGFTSESRSEQQNFSAERETIVGSRAAQNSAIVYSVVKGRKCALFKARSSAFSAVTRRWPCVWRKITAAWHARANSIAGSQKRQSGMRSPGGAVAGDAWKNCFRILSSRPIIWRATEDVLVYNAQRHRSPAGRVRQSCGRARKNDRTVAVNQTAVDNKNIPATDGSGHRSAEVRRRA